MVVLIAGVGALFYLGRTSRPAPAPEPGEDSAAGPSSAQGAAKPSQEQAPTLLSEGFDYEQQLEGKPVFRLQGDRFTTDREGRVSIEGAHVEIYREGEPFRIRSKHADFDPESHDAQLGGEVLLEGGGGWSIEATRLEVTGGGKLVVSRGDRVKIRRGEGFGGGAERVTYSMDAQTLRLTGKVRLGGRESPDQARVQLTGEDVLWDRDGRTIDATEGVELEWGESRLRSARLRAVLDSTQNGLVSAIATGRVAGSLRQPGERRLAFDAESAEVEFESGGRSPSRIRLSAVDPGAPVEVRVRAEAEHPRRLRAPLVEVSFRDGQPSAAHAGGGIVLEERVARGQTRTLRGETLDGTFGPEGDLEAGLVQTNVVLAERDLRATGDRASLGADGRAVALDGAPAHARSDRGELTAPRLEYASDTGSLHASGGVRATLRSGAGPIARDPASRGDEPTQVEAADGEFLDATRSFAFAGGVQAIQAGSFLFADRLEGSDASGKSRASGRVKTIWKSAPVPGKEDPGATTTTAETLDFDRVRGEIHYAGAVKVRQPPRELSADDVVVTLDAKQQAQRLRATGAVKIQDRSNGRTVEGADADYDLQARTAVVTGQPAIVRDSAGSVLRGRRALYDLATGSARLLSEQP